MKQKIISCLATTTIALLILTTIAYLYKGHYLCLSTVYEVFLANILIHIGLNLLSQLETPFYLLDTLFNITCISLVIFLLGLLFHWFDYLSPWILLLMGLAVYILGGLIDLFNLHRELSKINQCLQLEKEKRHPSC